MAAGDGISEGTGKLVNFSVALGSGVYPHPSDKFCFQKVHSRKYNIRQDLVRASVHVRLCAHRASGLQSGEQKVCGSLPFHKGSPLRAYPVVNVQITDRTSHSILWAP